MAQSKSNAYKDNLLLTFLFFVSSAIFSQNLPENGIYHYVRTDDGVLLYVLEIGKKNTEDTYIVLHGGFGAEHSYLVKPLLPHTNKNRFILFDQRGSLRSPAADSLITFQKFIDDLEQIRKEFNLDKLNILAHSNGTTIALDYLYHYPDRVNKMILVGCPLSIVDGDFFGNIEEPLSKYWKEIEVWQTRVNQEIEATKKIYGINEDDSLTTLQATLLQKIKYSANHSYLMNEIEKTENAFFNNDVYSALSKNTQGEDWQKRTSHMSEAMANNSIPMVIINGEHDFTDPSGHVWREIGSQKKHIQHLMIKESGHNIWLDQPKEFKKVLKKVL